MAPADVLSALVALGARIERLHAEAYRRLGLTGARVRLLALLRRDGPMTSTDLARRLDVTPRAVTTLVDALEAQGLVTRRPHPTDGRASVVVATAAGLRTGAAIDAAFERTAEELLRHTDPEDVEATLIVLRRIGERLEPTRYLSTLQARIGDARPASADPAWTVTPGTAPAS